MEKKQEKNIENPYLEIKMTTNSSAYFPTQMLFCVIEISNIHKHKEKVGKILWMAIQFVGCCETSKVWTRETEFQKKSNQIPNNSHSLQQIELEEDSFHKYFLTTEAIVLDCDLSFPPNETNRCKKKTKKILSK